MGQMHPRKPFSNFDPGEARAEVREKLDNLKHRARDASLSLQDQLRQRPAATIVAVSGTSFVLGSIFGSRIARAAVLFAAGYALAKVIGPGGIDAARAMRGWTEPGKA